MANYGMGHDEGPKQYTGPEQYTGIRVEPKAYSENAEPSPSRSLAGGLEEVESEIQILDACVSALYSKLDPILFQEEDGGEPGDAEKEPRKISGVGERIYRQADHINRLNDAIKRLLDRIDV